MLKQRDPDSDTYFHQIFIVVKETHLPNWAGFAITSFLPDAQVSLLLTKAHPGHETFQNQPGLESVITISPA